MTTTSLYLVDVRQSQNSVACPNGGNKFHPTICFFGFTPGGMNHLASPNHTSMTLPQPKSTHPLMPGQLFRHTNPALFSRIYSYEHHCFMFAR
jgi:hypothetical protein